MRRQRSATKQRAWIIRPMIDFYCPQCANHVRIDVLCNDEYRIEAWCCTRHSKPVEMTRTDPPA